MTALYYVREGKPSGEYNATNKAREDAEKILKSSGFKPLNVPTKYGVSTSKIGKLKQAKTYVMNSRVWQKSLKPLKSGDTILIQHPLTNTTLLMDKVLTDLRNRGVKVIVLIHDVSSLRYLSLKGTSFMKRCEKEDQSILKNSDKIICHNPRMTEKIVKKFRLNPDKIVNLELFDYLLNDEKLEKPANPATIVIAGNLSSKKAAYLKSLDKIPFHFNLYGKDYDGPKSKDLSYLGTFRPDHPPVGLKTSAFGLLWDGDSLDKLTGDMGQYLSFNNPHKASLYLACGVPIIAPENSAIADFVREHQVGIVVKSPKLLPEALKRLKPEDYKNFRKNAGKLSKKIQSGEFLKTALKKATS